MDRDSYDNALAETVNGLYKTEVIEYLKADWQGFDPRQYRGQPAPLNF